MSKVSTKGPIRSCQCPALVGPLGLPLVAFPTILVAGSVVPEVPAGLVDLAEYQFDSDQIDGNQLENVLDPTG